MQTTAQFLPSPTFPNSTFIDHYNPLFPILSQPTIIVKRRIQKYNLVIGVDQSNKYDILDINGQRIGSLIEQSSSFGAVLRQFTNNKRSFTIKMFDNRGNVLLIIKRSYTLIKSVVRVFLPNGKEIGKSVQSLNVMKRKYSLFTNDSTNPFGLINTLPLSWKFPIVNNQKMLIGLVNRSFNDFLSQIFMDTTIYVIRMDYQSYAGCSDIMMDYNGLSLDQRAVVLANVISIDFDYFEEQN